MVVRTESGIYGITANEVTAFRGLSRDADNYILLYFDLVIVEVLLEIVDEHV